MCIRDSVQRPTEVPPAGWLEAAAHEFLRESRSTLRAMRQKLARAPTHSESDRSPEAIAERGRRGMLRAAIEDLERERGYAKDLIGTVPRTWHELDERVPIVTPRTHRAA